MLLHAADTRLITSRVQCRSLVSGTPPTTEEAAPSGHRNSSVWGASRILAPSARTVSPGEAPLPSLPAEQAQEYMSFWRLHPFIMLQAPDTLACKTLLNAHSIKLCG